MSYNTVIEQGSFISNGENTTIQIRSDFDWIKVYNYTKIGSTLADVGVEFYWQDGMPQGGGIATIKQGSIANDPLTVAQFPANQGFFKIDTSSSQPGPKVAVSAVTNATRPVLSTANTGALSAGSVVRLFGFSAGKQNLNGYDFAIDTVNVNTNFRIAAALEQAPGATAATGSYRQIYFNPQFYPAFRYICNMQSVGVNTVVTVTVPSNYVEGQSVTFNIPDVAYGMVEMNGLVGTVIAVDDAIGTQTITVNIDSSAFTPFVFPTALQWNTPMSKAMVVPNGEDSAYALAHGYNFLSDATVDIGFIGATLVAGVASPAGEADDVIYWIAGKSFSNT